MAFKEGDLVQVIPERAGPESRKLIGQVLTVRGINAMGNIRVTDANAFFKADKFEYAIKPGVSLKCIDAADSPSLQLNKVYKLEKIYENGTYKLEGFGSRYHPLRFELYTFARNTWWPEVGDKVLITDKDSWSAFGMEEYINDGVEYTVIDSEYENGRVRGVRLNNHYVYQPRISLTPVHAVKGKKEVKAAPVKPWVPGVVPPAPDSTLREDLYKAQERKGVGYGLCSFAFEGDGRQDLHTVAACHAALSRPDVGDEVKVLAYGLRHDIKRYVDLKGEDLTDYKRYVDYIINRSPWADAFITKDIEEACEKDMFMNVEVHRYIMAGACVAIRAAQEYSHRPKLFAMFVDNGHSEHTAWIMCCAIVPYAGQEYRRFSWTGGHDVLDWTRKMEDVITFFRGGYHMACVKDNEPFRTHHGAYRIANAIADYDHGPSSLKVWLDENVKAVRVGEGFNAKTVLNKDAIFAAAAALDKLIKG